MADQRCTQCGTVKPLDEFHRDRRRKTGRRPRCKSCVREYMARRYEEKGEELRAVTRAYYWENREKFQEWARLRKERDPEGVRQRTQDRIRARLEENPDLYREDYAGRKDYHARRWQRYYEAHKDTINARRRAASREGAQ